MVNTINGTSGNDSLIGTDDDDNIYGKGGNDTLRGGKGDDWLFGGNGNDVLVGDVGVNDYIGGAGLDRYTMSVRSSAGFSDDLVRDFVNGEDRVDLSAWGVSDFSQVQALLFADSKGRPTMNAFYDGYEHVLRLNGATMAQIDATDFIYAGGGARNETGTGFDDLMFGSTSGDTLNGAAGWDALFGGNGNDTLSGGADVDYFDGGAGFDTVSYAYSTEALDVNLLNQRATFLDGTRETMTGIEAVIGSAGQNKLTGSNDDNLLDGLTQNDILNGKLGNDTLLGGGAADIFVFDTALGPTNIDSLPDFLPGADEIDLARSVFSALPKGDLKANAFVVNDAGLAVDASDRIIYSNSTGALYYDPDGLGGVAAKQFATLDPGLGASISAGDFFVI